jgi:hypothetical protein
MASLSLQSMVQQLLYVLAGFGAPGLLHSEQHPQLVVLETPAHLAPNQKNKKKQKENSIFKSLVSKFLDEQLRVWSVRATPQVLSMYVTLQIKIG